MLSLQIEEVKIAGHAEPIVLRRYRAQTGVLPAVLYFHGGGFTSGSLDDADFAASFIAGGVPAYVVSVGYSLAPRLPFPAAPEDAYCAARWLIAHARAEGIDARRIAVAGHDAGGNLATSLAHIARDRGEFRLVAQALLAPLLDPSLTRLGNEHGAITETQVRDCAQCYRAYLPQAAQRLHPYAAPLESSRLAGLPPTLIASAEHDRLHVEAERYASALIAAGVPTQITRYAKASHASLAMHPSALAEVVTFLRQRLAVSPTAFAAPITTHINQ